eukprot:3395983-Amphidinium_carterae.1
MAEYLKMRRQHGHYGFVESHLRPPESRFLPFRRVRLGRLLDAAEREGLEIPWHIISAPEEYDWGYARCTNSVAAYMLCGERNWSFISHQWEDNDMWRKSDVSTSEIVLRSFMVS